VQKVPPTNDLMFKKLFGSEENKPILQGLIHDVWGLDLALDDITIVHAYSIKAYEQALQEELHGTDITPSREIALHETLRDITVVCHAGDLLTELQVRKDDYFDQRALYYAYQRYCDNYNVVGQMRQRPDGKPMRFSSLRPVKALNILDHTRFPDDKDAFRVFGMYDPVHHQTYPGPTVTIATLELPKPQVDGALQYWLQFFTGHTIDPTAPSYIHEAEAKLDYLNMSKEEKTVIDLLEKARAIRESEDDTIWMHAYDEGESHGLEQGIRQGIQEGVQQGRRQAMDDMAAMLKDAGYDAETIAWLQAGIESPPPDAAHA